MGCGFGKECKPRGRIRGVCPKGWHLPSSKEWEILFKAVGGKYREEEERGYTLRYYSVADKKLKSQSGWENHSNGTDDFDFSVLPVGARTDDGEYYAVGKGAYFWLPVEFLGPGAYYWGFDTTGEDVFLNVNYKNSGLCVRCIKDYD